MMNNRGSQGIYIHIPFCVKKCNYCDFLSFHAGDEIKKLYIDCLCNEIRRYCYGKSVTADSVFIGGGTPSVLEPELMEKLMLTVRDVFGTGLDKNAEITVETNPGTLNKEKTELYIDLGINRISMGVQSLDDVLLKRIGRIHRRNDVFEMFELLRKNGFENINTDLMFALPEQSSRQWKDTLDEIFRMRPEHISFYSLIIEEGTQFYDEMKSGKLTPASDETDRFMYHYALSRLREEGYRQYEISNSAIPGKESVHNMKYWEMKDYIGFGLGAHSFVGGVRFRNTDDMNEYVNLYSKKEMNGCCLPDDRITGIPDTYIVNNINTAKDNAEEYIFTGLRLVEGISTDRFEKYTGINFMEKFGEQAEKLSREEMIEITGERVRLTEKGLDFANYVIRELMACGD